jgi:hypothetical protein
LAPGLIFDQPELSLDTHVNRSDLQEVSSSVRPIGSPAENKGFDPEAIKLAVMKLTSDSAGKTSNAHGSAISLFPLKEARRLPGA